MRYKCTICGSIYDEEKEKNKFDNIESCPSCGCPKFLLEKTEEIEKEKDEYNFTNAVKISKDNPSIERINEKCIDCGMCAKICMERENIKDICSGELCVNCGQCTTFCPTSALIPKIDKDKFYEAKQKGKVLVAYTSPSVRVSLGDEFNLEKGSLVQGKLVSSLRKLGFNYVFDVTFAADLTIMEEANELIKRIKNNETLPMFTSCCPSWVKYAEIFYPEILNNISTCKSPIGMMGEVVKNYFSMKSGIDKNDIYAVAITPCTAKKYEIKREEITGTDLVLTVRELADILKEEKIDFASLEDSNYDSLLGEGSGAGIIFGNTGGVMEAALREAYYILTGNLLENIEFNSVRGMDNVKEAEVDIDGKTLKVAVIHKMSSAIPILDEVKNGTSKYDYIEIMNCYGGCIGGGGQPKVLEAQEKEVKEKRIETLYKRDKEVSIRYPHENKDIVRIYDEFFGSPLSEKSEELLHTSYKDKSKILDDLLEKAI